MSAKAKIGVLGASGYTGAELVRLLLRHPHTEIGLLTADRRAGKPMADVFPQFAPYDLPVLQALDGRGLAGARSRPGILRAAARHHPDGDCRFARAHAGDEGRRSVGRFPHCRSGFLRTLVRASACRGRAAEESRLWAERTLSRADQIRAACRQSRLLHELRGACAHSAAARQGDRSGRDRDRRQVRHDRRGPGGQRGNAVLRSVGRLSCLWRRPPPPHGRARPGILQSRRARRGGFLHAASGADEPRHSVHDLCARPRKPRRRICMRCWQRLTPASRSCMCCRSASCRRPGMCAART